MNVNSIVNKAIQLVTPKMHKARRSTLVCFISSLLQGNALTDTFIGRGIESNTTDKHSINRADRMCSNNNLLNKKQNYRENRITETHIVDMEKCLTHLKYGQMS